MLCFVFPLLTLCHACEASLDNQSGHCDESPDRVRTLRPNFRYGSICGTHGQNFSFFWQVFFTTYLPHHIPCSACLLLSPARRA